MYTIYVDKPRSLIALSVTGYCDRETVIEMCADFRVAVRQLGSAVGQHDILVNLTQAPVAPGDAIMALAAVLTDPQYGNIKARRLAFYTPSPLLRLQLERLTTLRDGIGVFDGRIPAFQWLGEGREALAA